MAKPELISFTPIEELFIQEYERYLPTAFDESLTILEKMNKVIQQLYALGKLSTDLLNKWNEVMEWVQNDGLTEEVNNKLDSMVTDGTLDQIINQKILGDLTTKSNNPLAQIGDSSIPSSKLKVASDTDKIKIANLSEEVKGMMTGQTPVGTTPSDGSVTAEKITAGAILESKIGFRFRQANLLANTMEIDTINKTVALTLSTSIGINGRYYTVPAQTVVYTGLNTRVNYVFLNLTTLTIEVYETGLAPFDQQLALICSFFNNQILDALDTSKIYIDGFKGVNVQRKTETATVLSGDIIVTTDPIALTHTITTTALRVTHNTGFVNVADSVLTVQNPSNRIQYVYLKKDTMTIVCYENNLVPNDHNLALLFSFYLGYIYNCNSFKGVTVEGRTLTQQALPATNFEGLEVNVIGDSITEGTGGTVPYATTLLNVLGAETVRNYGVSGTTIAKRAGRTDSIVERYTAMVGTDIVYVMGGTNDFWTEIPLGSMGSKDDSTFYGALDVLVNGLINKYPNAFIVFGTPPKGWRDPGGTAVVYPNEGTNDIGLTMEQYNKAIKDVCGYYTIPVLDMKHELGIDPSIPIHFTTYSSDGIHYNNKGYEVIGKTIASFVKTKYNR